MNLQEHIRRIIKEETEHLSKQDKLKKLVLKLGWNKVAEILGGFDNLYRIGFNNDYNEFLELFNNLDVVQSEQEPDWMLYRFEKGNNMMIYERKNDFVYINYLVWSFFSEGIGLNNNETHYVMMMWLDEVYNLSEVKSIVTGTPYKLEVV